MKVRLFPRPGLKVPIPGGGYLPSSGLEVEENSYWRRRKKSGDVMDKEEDKNKEEDKKNVKEGGKK